MIDPFWGHLIGVMIVLLMLGFIGTCVWAWHRGNRRAFDDLARLPMNDGEVGR